MVVGMVGVVRVPIRFAAAASSFVSTGTEEIPGRSPPCPPQPPREWFTYVSSGAWVVGFAVGVVGFVVGVVGFVVGLYWRPRDARRPVHEGSPMPCSSLSVKEYRVLPPTVVVT